MELSEIREKIELNLKEVESLFEEYIKGVKDKTSSLNKNISNDQRNELDNLIDKLKTVSINSKQNKIDFSDLVEEITIKYKEYIKIYLVNFEKKYDKYISTFENIKILRHPLYRSQLAESVGYDKENKLMDIAYKRGGIYRYYDVPEELYLNIYSKSSFKDLKKELSIFEVKKIE